MRQQEVQGNVGGSVVGRDMHITHHHNAPCPGRDACPFRSSTVPQSLQEEAEFHRLAGFRTGAHEQKLLDEFRCRHRLNWRGIRSIERMWRHRTLEYDVASDSLRLNPSPLGLAVGWFYFSMSVLVAVLATLAPAQGKAFNGDDRDTLAAVTMFLLAAASIWFSIEHMVAPEQLARRLAKKEAEAGLNQ